MPALAAPPMASEFYGWEWGRKAMQFCTIFATF